jgi:hypothetical protein
MGLVVPPLRSSWSGGGNLVQELTQAMSMRIGSRRDNFLQFHDEIPRQREFDGVKFT